MKRQSSWQRNVSRALCCIMWTMTLSGLSGCASKLGIVPLRANDPALNQLAWLAGSWITDPTDKQPTTNEEHWMQPFGGSMIGMNRTVQNAEGGSGARTVFYEFLRIEHSPAGITYLASPKGRQPPTPFKMIESKPDEVTFENAQHDFPQRIKYRREGNLLHGRIEGEQNGRPASEDWVWRRARIE